MVLALCPALAAVLAACQSPVEGSYLTCPAVAIVGGTEHVTRFQGAGRAEADIALEADIQRFSASCRLSGERADVRIAFEISARRGAALGMDTATVPFFVAVTDAEGRVLAKTLLDATLSFDGGDTATRREEIEQAVVPGEGQRPRDFQVLVGFQLSPGQIDDNFAARGG